jgi:hypothetical protein
VNRPSSLTEEVVTARDELVVTLARHSTPEEKSSYQRFPAADAGDNQFNSRPVAPASKVGWIDVGVADRFDSALKKILSPAISGGTC